MAWGSAAGYAAKNPNVYSNVQFLNPAGTSFVLSSGSRKPAAAAAPSIGGGTSPYSGEYKGLEPGTISAQPLLDYMTQVKTLALDPQEELRQREQQKLQEQTRAGLEQRGLNLSGAGAGIEAQAMTNFGLDWQNNLLGRAATGGQTLANLGGLGQNIAQAGFSNQGELGSSAFEYQPQPQQSAPSPMSYMGGGTQAGPSVWEQQQAFLASRVAENRAIQAEQQRLMEETNRRYGGSWYRG